MAVVPQGTLPLPGLRDLPLVQGGQVKGHRQTDMVLRAVQVHGDQTLPAARQAAELERLPVDPVAVRGLSGEPLLLLRVEPGGQRQVAAGGLGHVLHLVLVRRVSLPLADSPPRQGVESQVEEPRERRLPHRGQQDPATPQHADQRANRGDVRGDLARVGSVGHDQRGVVKDDADGQPRRVDRLHLVVPVDQVVEGEELGPVGTAVGSGVRVLHRPVAQRDRDRPAAAHRPPHPAEQLVVDLRAGAHAHPERPRQHGVQGRAGQPIRFRGGHPPEVRARPGRRPMRVNRLHDAGTQVIIVIRNNHRSFLSLVRRALAGSR